MQLVELRGIGSPVRFEFQDKPFIVEIQYFYAGQGELGQLENGYLVFAATTDGGDLLIEAGFGSGAVLQREGEEVDSIDVTLGDMLKAKHIQL